MDNKKKILFVIPTLSGGGAESVVQILLEGLRRDRYRPVLVLLESEVVYPVPGDVKRICLHKRGRYDFFRVIWKLAGVFKEERPSVVISFLTYTNIVASVAKFLSRWKGGLILTEHENINIALRHARARGVKKFLIRNFYHLSDYIICVSDGLRRVLKENFSIPPGKLKTIHNAVDLPRIIELSGREPGHPWYEDKETPIVVTVGRLVRPKAHPDLLRAFAIVRKKVDCRLVIVGEGQDRDNIEALIKDLGISRDVAMVGFHENPFSFMAHSDVFVLSSHWEGFGNVIIEAMACGVPVISTNCSYGPDEIITDGVNGLLVPVGDINAMAGTILKLLEDEPLRRRLAEGGRTRSEDFGTAEMVSEYEEVFEQPGGNSRSPESK